MSNKQPDVERWYFKTFRIYDSPKKDKPEEAITKATFDSFVGELVVELHNKAIDKAAATIKRQQAEIERLKKLCYYVAMSVPIPSLGHNYIKLIKASKEWRD